MIFIILTQLIESFLLSLFLIYSKGIKDKRNQYTILMGISYMIIANLFFEKIYFYILLMFVPYLISKLLYKKSIITDIFLMNLAYLLTFIIAVLTMIIGLYIENLAIIVILNKFFTLISIITLKNKLKQFYNFYCKNWNRNFENKNIIKSLTLRNLSIILLSLLLVIANAFFVISS